jgi:hypothetical protein
LCIKVKEFNDGLEVYRRGRQIKAAGVTGAFEKITQILLEKFNTRGHAGRRRLKGFEYLNNFETFFFKKDGRQGSKVYQPCSPL